MQLKRWESPRREGRNDKGRGGAARKRQLKKQRQMLRNKLKQANKPKDNKNYGKGEDFFLPPFLLSVYREVYLERVSSHKQQVQISI
ncbi:hypothetical protein [Nodularia sphaerocarpa]|uniref:hypothetical protein n=1 Tax=Nodularia sphaerocarpa TaxID=137816 RepID=UPI001EFBADB6|nr:hypothetical protein [Nodularia sphaerocarpa]MDB9374361.1 hypothetical protein [Nodularia sphaerocarpa CS-585]ULP73561.1 hypothetical protein BDGGKGIB_03216 [Nodularia sphaerocarpa UHCC 0038]